MTTDKTPATLATVKHGGCVQLPTSERARFEAWAKLRVSSMARAADGEYVTSFTHALWCAWQTALSAQPSPGGQGDALVDTARRNIRQFISKASFSSSVDKQAALSCVDVLEAALAARQPVGEPAAFVEHFTDRLSTLNLTHAGLELGIGKHALYAAPPAQVGAVPCIDYEDLVDQAKDLIHCGCSVNGAFDWLLEQLTDGEATAAPPAQAVDLERFRPAVMTSLGLSSPNSTERETLRELLALIDGKAVGK